MDEAAIEARGTAPLQPFLDQINAVSDKAALQKVMGSAGFNAPFGMQIDADPADPTRYCVWVSQEGLAMPNRDYYLNTGEKFAAYRAAYQKYVTRVFELLGNPDPAQAAAAVIAIETKIAQVHWTPTRSRNIKEINNPMDRAGLQQLAPSIDWDVVLSAAQLGAAEKLIVTQTTAIRDGAKLLDSVPLADWKTYLTFHFVAANDTHLPKAFDEAQFDFYAKTLRGTQQQRDRWKRGIGLLSDGIGEGLGQLYVEKHFPPGHKAKMDELVANLRAALEARIESLGWMDDPTRAAALQKLAAFEPRIGYPQQWRDYSALRIEPGKHFENMRALTIFEWNRRVSRLKQTVDRNEWDMSPQTVDAYYNALQNQITFPAGILQPPFFDPNADPAVNYGSIGAIIGHEIGHGFDDQGREFDGTGKIRNWWTPVTSDKFVAITKALAAQYAQYCPIPNQCVNGELTTGENIGPVIEGFTGEQRFFIAYASAWRSKAREDALRAQMLTDPHSPAAARGQYPVRNMDAWYAAFDVKPDHKLYLKPEDRVHIWQ
jgi:endothelin-converting enzyme/putative endopeptidase